MQLGDGKRSYNLFCGGIYPRLGQQGQAYYSFEMEDSGRGQHLSGPSQSRRICNRLPSKDGIEVGGKSGRGQSLRCAGTISSHGVVCQSPFFWLRQAGKDQFKRQIDRACRYPRESSLGGKFFRFCDMVGKALRQKTKRGSKKHFRCDEGVGVMIWNQPDWVTFRVVSRLRGMVDRFFLLPRASTLNSNVGSGGGKYVLWGG